MSKYNIGIDLGTTTTIISIFEDGLPIAIEDPIEKSAIVPSVVGYNPNATQNKLTVGFEPDEADAQGQIVREVKRIMGEQAEDKKPILNGMKFKPEEISAEILKKVVENAEIRIGEEIKDVVITVPAVFLQAPREATINAAKLAGLNVLRLIQEPVAAALAFGIKNLNTDQKVIVFDLGGGTLDVSILEIRDEVLDVTCSHGDAYLGGTDFDKVLETLILSKFKKKSSKAKVSDKFCDLESGSVATFKRKIMDLKKELSHKKSANIAVAGFATENGKPVDLNINISQKEFKESSKDLLNKIQKIISETLKKATLKPSSIDSILMVGGSTLMPMIRTIVSESFAKPVNTDLNPVLAVSLGASIQAAIINGDSDIITGAVSAYSIGVNVINSVGGQLVEKYEALIEPNESIPKSIQKSYALLHPEQTHLEMKVFQTSKNNTSDFEGATLMDVINIPNIPQSNTDEPHEVLVNFSYNLDGMIEVKASIPAAKLENLSTIKEGGAGMSDEELEEIRERMQLLEEAKPIVNIDEKPLSNESSWGESEYASVCKPLIAKAEELSVGTKGESKGELMKHINNLKQALISSNKDKIDDMSDELTDYIFELEDV